MTGNGHSRLTTVRDCAHDPRMVTTFEDGTGGNVHTDSPVDDGATSAPYVSHPYRPLILAALAGYALILAPVFSLIRWGIL